MVHVLEHNVGVVDAEQLVDAAVGAGGHVPAAAAAAAVVAVAAA